MEKTDEERGRGSRKGGPKNEKYRWLERPTDEYAMKKEKTKEKREKEVWKERETVKKPRCVRRQREEEIKSEKT